MVGLRDHDDGDVVVAGLGERRLERAAVLRHVDLDVEFTEEDQDGHGDLAQVVARVVGEEEAQPWALEGRDVGGGLLGDQGVRVGNLRPLLGGQRRDLLRGDLDQPRFERRPRLGLRERDDLALLRDGLRDLLGARARRGGDALDLGDHDLGVRQARSGHRDDEGDLVAERGGDATDDHRALAVAEQPDATGVDRVHAGEVA